MMTQKERRRFERLLDDLMWLVADQHIIDVPGEVRDSVSEIRDLLWEAVE